MPRATRSSCASAGDDVRGTVDLIGSASIRLRTLDGGHLARRPRVDRVGDEPVAASAVSDIEDPSRPGNRPTGMMRSTSGVGLERCRARPAWCSSATSRRTSPSADADTVTVRVKSNRPLTSPRKTSSAPSSRLLTADASRAACGADQSATQTGIGRDGCRVGLGRSRYRSVGGDDPARRVRRRSAPDRRRRRSAAATIVAVEPATNGDRPWTADVVVDHEQVARLEHDRRVWQRSIAVAHLVDDLLGNGSTPTVRSASNTNVGSARCRTRAA